MKPDLVDWKCLVTFVDNLAVRVSPECSLETVIADEEDGAALDAEPTQRNRNRHLEDCIDIGTPCQFSRGTHSSAKG
jgi:hypothetical protein